MFKVIPNHDAIALIRAHEGKKIYEFSENLASPYKLKDGTFIILPQNGDSSLFFLNSKDYDDFLKEPNFPPPADKIYFSVMEHIKRIDQSLPFFYDRVREVLDTLTFKEITNDEDLKVLFGSINRYLSQLDIDKTRYDNEFYSKLYVPLGIIIGDYIAKKYDLHWELSKVYTLQPYFIPRLKRKGHFEFSLWGITDEYFESNNFDIKDFLRKVDSYLKR